MSDAPATDPTVDELTLLVGLATHRALLLHQALNDPTTGVAALGEHLSRIAGGPGTTYVDLVDSTGFDDLMITLDAIARHSGAHDDRLDVDEMTARVVERDHRAHAAVCAADPAKTIPRTTVDGLRDAPVTVAIRTLVDRILLRSIPTQVEPCNHPVVSTGYIGGAASRPAVSIDHGDGMRIVLDDDSATAMQQLRALLEQLEEHFTDGHR